MEVEANQLRKQMDDMKLPMLLESDGKLLIDWTADGNCVLYPKLFRDGHDWYAFIDDVFNHWDVKL